MRQRKIIVIGGSAGSIDPLKRLVAALSPTLPAALFVVVHLSPESPELLPEILTLTSKLPVIPAADQLPIRLGHLYVARPNHHLLLEAGWIRVTHGPKENRFRPAIDPLFRSAAYAFGREVIGVVLSGMLDDGTAGLWAIKDRGGVAIVQEPTDALYTSMPQNALRYVAVDYRLPMADIAAKLEMLVEEPLVEAGELPMSNGLAVETKIALEENALRIGILGLGKPSRYTCPACHGVLFQIEEGQIVRYRCHTGHAYSQEALLNEVDASLEMGLWNAVRAMDEAILLLCQMADQAGQAGDGERVERLRAKAEEIEQRSQQIRQFTLRHDNGKGQSKELGEAPQTA